MNILGLHTVWHDTGACLISGGKLFAISEERLSRVKYDGAFPTLSIDYVLKAAGISLKDVDLIVLDHLQDKAPQMEKKVRGLGYKGRVHFIDHHDSHAAGVYYQSGFEDAAILIVDGTGSFAHASETGKAPHYFAAALPEPHELHSYYRGHGNRFVTLDKTWAGEEHRGSIGMFYDAVSYYCNFGPFGAGKVMGLASYGGKNPKSHELLFEERNHQIVFAGKDKMIPKHLPKYAGQYFWALPIRDNETLPDDKYAELAYLAQHNCEQALIRMARHLHDVTGSKNLCVSGGVGLNSVANKIVLDETPFENIFIHPGCSDTGIPIGNALYGHHVVCGNTNRFTMRNAYTGRSYSDAEIGDALKGVKNIRVEKLGDSVVEKSADLLAQGKIFGWFQGGSEIGPRALGHRSILCDPRPADAKDKLNLRVKHREHWRPFAPSILLEHVSEYFDLDSPSPYMLLIAAVKENKRALLPAITHVDGTARVQTVTKDANDLFYELIKAFHKKTGLPVLTNTSFNVAGEAIVETPADALKCFLNTEIDHLVLGGHLVSKV